MAAVKSQAGQRAMQTTPGRKKGSVVKRCVQDKNTDVQIHRQRSCLGEVWRANSEHSHTLLFFQSSSEDVPYRSPESAEMDEIMAAMVLTSLSCSPVIQSPTQRDLLPCVPVDMECGGGELSDSGSSGCWSWEHGSVSPALSPSITEAESSTGHPADERLSMELDLEVRDEVETRRIKNWSRGTYRCLWPGCSKVLTSRVGMKRHIRVLHLGGPEHAHREEDFYYTEVSSQEEEPMPISIPSLSLTTGHRGTSSSAPIQRTSRQTSQSSTALSQSAPSSVWQIHTEHLYQACVPIEATVFPDSPSSCDWTSSGLQLRPQSVPRSRSVSMGEQCLQPDTDPTRSHSMSSSPSRVHCANRKGRGEAKKCRKVYGVERRNDWCTACRWKKACQRFPD